MDLKSTVASKPTFLNFPGLCDCYWFHYRFTWPTQIAAAANSLQSIHSASLCLLVGAFNPFTFRVITEKYDPVAIYFIVLSSNLYTVFVFPV